MAGDVHAGSVSIALDLATLPAERHHCSLVMEVLLTRYLSRLLSIFTCNTYTYNVVAT